MNARIRQLSALAAAMALAAPAAAFAQDTTTEKLDQIEQDASPPPVSDIDDNMEPIDPEVDAMTQPPRQADDTDAMDVMDDSADEPDPMHDDSGQEEMREHQAASEPGLWAQLDTNGDGRVSREEGSVNADFSANFEMIDADSDGFVSDAEFKADAQGSAEDEENDEW